MAGLPAAAEGESSGVVVLDEILDPSWEPSEAEVWRFAVERLMMAPDVNSNDRKLLWIAKAALKAPLPRDWKLCQQRDPASPGVLTYYFNFKTGEWRGERVRKFYHR